MRRLLVVALVLATAGCASAGETIQDPPDGLTISVYQPRPDIPKNRIAIEVHNDGDEPVTITAATLESNYFAEGFVWGPGRTATIAPGYAVDLRVDIPAVASCDAVTADNAVSFAVGLDSIIVGL